MESLKATNVPPAEWAETLQGFDTEGFEDFMTSITLHYTEDGRRIEERYLKSAQDKLAQLPLFQALDSPEFMKALSERLRPMTAKWGTRIIKKGEIGDRMYFICGGTCDVLLDLKQVRGPATWTIL